MPSNDKKNKKRKNSNMTGLVTLIAWALFLTVIINYMANYSMRNNDARSAKAEILFTDLVDMVKNDEVASVSFTDELINITPVEGYIYTDPDGQEYTGNITLYTSIINSSNLFTLLDEHDVPYTKPYVAKMSPVLSVLLSMAPFLLILGLTFFMFRGVGGKGGMGGMMNVGKANAKVYMEKSTGVTFADVAGQDEAKESLVEIIDFLHNPGKYTAIGAKLPKGALLVGSPGTGKTLLAKAVAGEAKVPFFSISGSDFVEMFVGVGASRVRDLFKEAAKVAPCIIFIDEIDTIGKSRDASKFGGNDEREQTLNQLLSELDGFDPSKGIIVLGATNRPEVLDKALLRPGRFDRRITVDRPNLAGRLATLQVHTRNIRLSEDVDLNKIAQATAGCVGADLANLVNEAALRAVRLGRHAVNQNDLLVSFETVIAGSEKKGTVLTEKEKRLVAYHEVGHALVAAMQKGTEPVQKITIVPHTQGALGYTMQTPEEERFLMDRDEIYAELRILLGGRAAEKVAFNTMTTGASNDIERATDLARKMITMYGMSDKFGVMGLATIQNQYLDGQMGLTCAQDTAAEVDDEIHAVLMHCFGEAVQILEDNRTLLDEIAGYLLIKETITGAEMMSFIHNEPIAAEPAPAAQSDDAAAEDPSAVPAGEMRSSADAAPAEVSPEPSADSTPPTTPAPSSEESSSRLNEDHL
ncbi:MAG: ATP-dependent zinc metalloprotease FtsH [Clostridiales bacterium]|nr:ATP-dependent zinc metalloprotease FtsH [Clostridiales bacterium]